MNEDKKTSTIDLIRDFFAPPQVGMQEVKALTSEDRVQLASGIARLRGIPDTDLAFVPVAY